MRIQGLACWALTAAVIGAAGIGGTAQAAVVFTDTFGNSTLNQTSTPSGGTTTSYDIASSKVATSSIASGALDIGLPTTNGGIVEAQAIFSSTPLMLATIGDVVDLNVTFTLDSASSIPATAYFGLFKSGGNAPATTLQNSGLSSGTTGTQGNAAGYVGYATSIQATASSKINTRPAQSQSNNTAQDLLTAGVSGSQSYTGATALKTSTTGAVATLAAGAQYTEDYSVSLTSAGTYTIASNLYSGASVTGTPIATISTTDSTFLYNGFDALAFGYRDAANDKASQLDVNSVTVNATIAPTPEPASLGVLALGAMALVSRRRKA